jgi:hypothetical protein
MPLRSTSGPELHGEVPVVRATLLCAYALGCVNIFLGHQRSTATGCSQHAMQCNEQGGTGFGRRFIGLGLPGGYAVYQRFDVVAAQQQGCHQFVANGQRAGAHAVQHVFHHMGEGHHMVQAEQSAGAFDGVGSAKDGVDLLGLVLCCLQCQQGTLHVFEQLAALGDKDEQGLI